MARIDYSTFDDDTLWREMKRRDKQAFTALYNRYLGILRAEAIRRLKNRELAEEAVNDVMQKVGERCHEIEIDRSVKQYLFGALQKHCAYIERGTKPYKKMIAVVALKDPEYSFQPDLSEVKKPERQELKKYIKAALHVIDSRTSREAFELYLENTTQKDIARILGISLDAVRQRIRRTKKKLQAFLKKNQQTFIIIIISYLLQS